MECLFSVVVIFFEAVACLCTTVVAAMGCFPAPFKSMPLWHHFIPQELSVNLTLPSANVTLFKHFVIPFYKELFIAYLTLGIIGTLGAIAAILGSCCYKQPRGVMTTFALLALLYGAAATFAAAWWWILIMKILSIAGMVGFFFFQIHFWNSVRLAWKESEHEFLTKPHATCRIIAMFLDIVCTVTAGIALVENYQPVLNGEQTWDVEQIILIVISALLVVLSPLGFVWRLVILVRHLNPSEFIMNHPCRCGDAVMVLLWVVLDVGAFCATVSRTSLSFLYVASSIALGRSLLLLVELIVSFYCSRRSRNAKRGSNYRFDDIELVENWAAMSDSKPVRVKLEINHEDYVAVAQLFRQTMPLATIHRIERIQSPCLWKKFDADRTQMHRYRESHEINQRRLFHGTNADAVNAIIRHGFDRGLAGTAAGQLDGKGIYFARDAKYCDCCATADAYGLKQLFVAEVLVGVSTKGDKDYVCTPLQGPNLSADSCVDDVLNPSIFVILRDTQCYPHFLITYS